MIHTFFMFFVVSLLLTMLYSSSESLQLGLQDSATPSMQSTPFFYNDLVMQEPMVINIIISLTLILVCCSQPQKSVRGTLDNIFRGF